MLEEQKEVLKSVVSLKFYGKKSWQCTGTLVAKNILLTASHCYKSHQFNLMTVNDRLALLKAVEEAKTTMDTVLILVHSTALKDLPIVPLATGTEKDYADFALIAGYGEAEDGHAGVLNAGYSHQFKSTQMPTLPWINNWFPKGSLEILSSYGPGIGFLVGKKSIYNYSIFNPGQDKKSNLVFNPPSHSPVLLNGDSGSAIIGFDHRKRPKVIGILSFGVFTGKTSILLTAYPTVLRGLRKPQPLFRPIRIIQDPDSKQNLSKALDQFFAGIKHQSYVDKDENTLKPFIMSTLLETPILDGYISLFYPPYQEALSQSAKELHGVE